MRCRSARILMTRHLRETLAPSQQAALSRHLAACPACREEEAALTTFAARLQAARPPSMPVTAPPVAQWASARGCPRRARASWIASRAPVAAALAGAAVIAGALMLAHGHRRPVPPRVVTAAFPDTAGFAPHQPSPGPRAHVSHGRRSPSPDAVLSGTDRRMRNDEQADRPRPPGTRRMNSRAGKAQSPPSRTPDAVREGGLRAFEARGFNRRERPRLRAVLAAVSTAGSPAGHSASPDGPRPRGDLAYLNDEGATASRRWVGPTSGEVIHHRARRTRVPRADDFVFMPLPRIAAGGPGGDRAAAQALAAYEREVAVVDARLAHPVTLAFKATALSDLCDHLRADTGITLTAGRSVADEKVTLFCKQMPLRDVMRQLSRPFGYAWLRSGKSNEYRYELVQDLKSQLLEEELRNRDRNEALLALDREMQRYRKYLGLTPDEALARAKTASPEEKKLLQNLADNGWGHVQIYFRLSPRDLQALRAGQTVVFSQEPKPDQQPLPAELARGILVSQRNRRITPFRDGLGLGNAENTPDGLLPAAVPEARAQLELQMPQSELGQFTFTGGPGVFIASNSSRRGYFDVFGGAGALAVGISPSVLNPNNGALNAKLARDPALRSRVTVQPAASCRLAPSPVRAPAWAVAAPDVASPEPRVTSADALEGLHRATRLPIVADYYTHLYPPAAVSVRSVPLFDALNQLADTMRLRWQTNGSWLQFRSTSFFNDRLKEVPNRLLTRWAASRREHGALTLDDLIEIAGLSDAQLDASSMAEGARACAGLTEWELPRMEHVRRHLRFLAEFTPAQRQQAQTLAGLPFTQMTLAQQQGYFARAFLHRSDTQLEDLARATLNVDYTLLGWFRWSPSQREDRPWPVREQTREAALQAARRIDPQATVEQIVPTGLDVTILYMPRPGAGPVHLVNAHNDGFL